MVAAVVCIVFDQTHAARIAEWFKIITSILGPQSPRVEVIVLEVKRELVTLTAFLRGQWRQVSSADSLEHTNNGVTCLQHRLRIPQPRLSPTLMWIRTD